MILETDRLILEPLALSDFDAQHAMLSQEAVYRYILRKPMSREEVWLRLLRDIGHWQALGHGNWSVKLKATGQHIGVIGVFDFHREIDPPLDALETGWVFDGTVHGQGYASEALKATLAYADENLKAPRTQCIIDIDNAPSLKLAERHGYKRLRTSLFHSQPVLVLERLADGRIS